MILAALALIQVPVLTPREQEVVVVGRRLKAFRGSFRSANGKTSCRVTRSSGDREIDALACQAITECSKAVEPRVLAIGQNRALNAAGRRAAMAPINVEMGRCMQARHGALVSTLADKRIAARAAP